MLLIIIISIFFVQLCFGMVYDEEFTYGLKHYNLMQQKIKQRTFKLIYQNKDYYEIININSILTIYKGDNQIAKLENDKENAYYFKFDSNYDYYIFFEFPNYSSEFYAFYISIGDKELNLITTSSLTLRYAKKREFSLKIKNNESTPQLIAIRIYMDKYGAVESFSFEDHGESFIPDYNRYDTHVYSEHHDTYYAIIEDELTFKPVIYYPYTQIYEYHSVTISLINDFQILSENMTSCISTSLYSNLIYFQLNPPLNRPYYEISFKENSVLYYIKNNFYRTKISSINEYTTNNYKFFMINTTNNEGCFSILFSDEKNTISEESSFSLSLFDSRNYEATFINTKKYIQIKFPKNDYFNMSIFLPSLGKKINYRYYNPTTKEYFFIFENILNELLVQFQFIRIGAVSTYYDIQLTYSGLNADIIEETIEDDTFKCCNTITFFNLLYNPEKKNIYLLTNDTSNFYINFVELSKISSNNNFYRINENEQIQIFPSENKICFELIYESNYGEFLFNGVQKRNFTLVSNNTFIFYLDNLVKYSDYYIEIESENENIEFSYYILDYKYNFNKFIYFRPRNSWQKFELPVGIKNKDKIDNLHIHFYYYERIKENTFQCLNKILYYNLTMNTQKKYIYLFTNDTENVYINNIKLKDEEGINNFYDLNEDKRLDIYASEKNIICFELMYENKKGIFEIIQKKYFHVFSYNYLEFDLLYLIQNMNYYIEIENIDNNLNFDYYKINDKQYNFIEKISYKAENEEAKLEFPVNLKNNDIISNFSICYYHIETIDDDTFKCCNTITFFNLLYNPEKKNIYLLTNDTSNFYINFVELSKISSNNNFYRINENEQIQIFPSENKICFELIYESNYGEFLFNGVQKRNFTLVSNNTFIFYLDNLVKYSDYYIEIESENENIEFSYYILDYKYNFNKFIYFRPRNSWQKFELPVGIKNKDKIDNLHIHFYYYERIKENTFQCLNKILYYNLTMNTQKKYIYLFTNDTENVYINNIKLKDEEGINNFYDLNEDKRLDIYASEKSIICFELMYENKKGIFEMDRIQIKYFNIFSDNYFQFDLINLIENMTYYIEITNKDNNVNFDYYKINEEQYNFIEKISYKAKTEEAKLAFPVSLKNKDLISNFSLYYYHIEIIENDTFKCLNTITYFNIKTHKEKEYIYLITNDTSNLYLDNIEVNSIKSTYNFYEIKNETNLDIFTDDDNIICFELKFQNSFDYFELKAEDNITFNIFTKNEFIFNLTNLKKDIEYYIDIKTDNSNLVLDKYYLDGTYHYFYYQIISFKPKKSNIIFKLPIDFKNKNEPDKLFIYFYHEKIEEVIEEPKYLAVKIASVLAYICFALVIIPIGFVIITIIYICCDEDSDCFQKNCSIFGIVGIYPWKKLGAIYLCKRD